MPPLAHDIAISGPGNMAAPSARREDRVNGAHVLTAPQNRDRRAFVISLELVNELGNAVTECQWIGDSCDSSLGRHFAGHPLERFTYFDICRSQRRIGFDVKRARTW